MDWPPNPKTWSDFPTECFWYLLPGLLVHAFFLALSLAIIGLIPFHKRRNFSFFNALTLQGYLLLTAMLMNGFWSCAVWGNLYWSVDYTADFSVFYPITKNVINYSWGSDMTGGLDGISLNQLNIIWAAFTATAWALAFTATFYTTRYRSLTKRGRTRMAPT